ncbi:hypothetical protein BJ508DRAFT_308055 [Ascobolus immersus RN42]|uniref:Uncharacterized protein n=1 Tax=Ascobolus immersus RN42 TaxID=1160509 RepID=A0A3N4I0W5_ASCIM|nr:hypothetical protein BJ508DRAFT_308055 [Ascobolus immersus RN42]
MSSPLAAAPESGTSTAPHKPRYVYQQILEERAKMSQEERNRFLPVHREAIVKELREWTPTVAGRERAQVEAMSVEERISYLMEKGYDREKAEKYASKHGALRLTTLGALDDRPGARKHCKAVRHILYDEDEY